MEDLLKTLKDNDSFNKLSLEISMAACRGYSTGKRQRFLKFMLRYITEIRMSFSKASSEMQTKDNEEDVMAMLKDQVQYYRKEKWEALELDALKRLSRLQLQNQNLGDYVASVIQMATLDPQRHLEDFHYCLTSINLTPPVVEQTSSNSGLSVKNSVSPLSFEVSSRLLTLTLSNPFQTIKIGDPLKLQLQFWTPANFQCDMIKMIVTNNNSGINIKSSSSINIDNIVNMEKQQLLATGSSDGQTPRTATRAQASFLPNEEVVLFPSSNVNNVSSDGNPSNSPRFTIENGKILIVPSFCLKKVGKFQIVQFKIHVSSTINCDLILPIRDANLIIIQDAPPIVNISTSSECYLIGKKQMVPIYLDVKGILYSGILKLVPIPGNFIDDIQLSPKDFEINEEVENKMVTVETEILVNSSKNARVQLLALFEIHGKGKYPIPLEKKLSLDFFHAFTYVADTRLINDLGQEKICLVQFKLKCNTPGPLIIRQHFLHSPSKGVHFTNSKEIKLLPFETQSFVFKVDAKEMHCTLHLKAQMNSLVLAYKVEASWEDTLSSQTEQYQLQLKPSSREMQVGRPYPLDIGIMFHHSLISSIANSRKTLRDKEEHIIVSTFDDANKKMTQVSKKKFQISIELLQDQNWMIHGLTKFQIEIEEGADSAVIVDIPYGVNNSLSKGGKFQTNIIPIVCGYIELPTVKALIVNNNNNSNGQSISVEPGTFGNRVTVFPENHDESLAPVI